MRPQGPCHLTAAQCSGHLLRSVQQAASGRKRSRFSAQNYSLRLILQQRGGQSEFHQTIRCGHQVACRGSMRSKALHSQSGADSSKEPRIKVVGLGLACWDFLAQVATFPKPDEKLRTQRIETRGGGNCANALTAASRLGVDTYIVTKVGNDSIGEQIVQELEADGVKTPFLLRDHGASHFSYMIVDKQGGTRTCIQTPGVEYTPKDLQPETVDQILGDTSLIYFDGRLTDSAVLLAKAARQRGVPVLVEAERVREGLHELLQQADYLCTSAHFPKLWTGRDTQGDAMLSILQQLPRVKWMITTLGKRGSVLVQKQDTQHQQDNAVLEDQLKTMLRQVASSSHTKSSAGDGAGAGAGAADCISQSKTHIRAGSVISSKIYQLQMQHHGHDSHHQHAASSAASDAASPETETGDDNCAAAVTARITVASAAHVPQEAIEDTTGAGDAFVGSVLYAITQQMPCDKMMALGALVAACNCTALGARPALPYAENINPDFLAASEQAELAS